MAISDIMVSPAATFSAPVGSSLPADGLAVGAAWPSGWQSVGYTKEALTVDYKYETLKYEIQESLGAVGSRKVKEELTLETTLAEFNLSGVAESWGGIVSVTTSGSAQVGKEEIYGGDITNIPVRMWGFEGTYVDSANVVRPIRMVIYRGQADAGGKLEFGKKDTTGIPLKIVALEDMTKAVGSRMFKIIRVTSDVTP